MSKFRSLKGFKWIDPKDYNLNKYTGNSSKGYVFKANLEYPKELWELHKDCPLVSENELLIYTIFLLVKLKN